MDRSQYISPTFMATFRVKIIQEKIYENRHRLARRTNTWEPKSRYRALFPISGSGNR
ncbi:hypothetical protein AFE_2966 [Acidithiobacillus ferrooxidans ATCC 23270]|uniref:Uncharacterized protein n=1 Tax=Acidithiobacillus ferrooxidans (strain ATCC 23270 / DSM 14882 / CIP 104768 / NCIMB 8455) TaxID=243159 RepID=B7J9T9_ACIF2|nr:hypothetical protein AFE_2966 [Acidithiobacillus ferrooxidans ATCC 23270]